LNAIRRVGLVVILTLLVLLAPVAAYADVNDPLVIESDLLVTAGPAEHEPSIGLMVQVTSRLDASGYRYILTIGNFTPWAVPAMRVLDRYLPEDPAQQEVDHDWLPGRLHPGQVASYVIEYEQGALVNACHQLEISLADGMDTLLMDCAAPGSTTVWNVPLSEEMSAYLVEPELTLAEPTKGSKLGIHVTSNHTPAILKFVRDAHPAVIVAVADLGWFADAKSASPETVTVGRFLQSDQSFVGDPAERAREFVSANVGRYREFSAVDYWLGWNEPVVKTAWEMAWYAAFESERAVAMAELGLKVAVGNFAAGNPEPDLIAEFLPALAVAKEHAGILALHEYSAPSMRDGIGAELPGNTANSQWGSLTLRYRYWYDHYLRVSDLVLPLVVSEAGIDGGVLREAEGPMGWRDFAEENGGSLDEMATSYVEQLSWYDDELRRDPYVLGFAVFNIGDTKEKWSSFDVTDLLPQLADLRNSKNE
jgi:hypothetical protein